MEVTSRLNSILSFMNKVFRFFVSKLKFYDFKENHR